MATPIIAPQIINDTLEIMINSTKKKIFTLKAFTITYD